MTDHNYDAIFDKWGLLALYFGLGLTLWTYLFPMGYDRLDYRVYIFPVSLIILGILVLIVERFPLKEEWVWFYKWLNAN